MELPCCRCLRRLRRLAADPLTPLACTIPVGLSHCASCAAVGRGGARGCVPLPNSLSSLAARLLAASSALAAGASGCPSEADVRALAHTLSLGMRGEISDASSRLPASNSAGRLDSGPIHSASGGPSARDVRMLTDAVRMMALVLAVGLGVEPPVWPEEVSSSEDSDES